MYLGEVDQGLQKMEKDNHAFQLRSGDRFVKHCFCGQSQ
jgi:hypothetical protein